MAITEVAGARPTRGRLVMLVDNGVRGDSRVQKEAASAAAAGWDVILLGSAGKGAAQNWWIGSAEVRLVPMPSPLSRRRHEFRRRWFRAPLAYPPSGIATLRRRQVEARRLDLTVRAAALRLSIGRTQSSATMRLVRRGLLGIESSAARITERWVARRADSLDRATDKRRRLDTLWDRAYTAMWWSVRGDRAWRRLEPRLWDYELAFGPVIDKLEPDLIHANDFYMLGVGARAAMRARAQDRRVPLVWDAHEFLPGLRPRSDHLRWMPAHRAYEREFVKYADAAVTVSDELAEILQREHGLAELPAVVLNAPEVDAAAAAAAPDMRELCGIGPNVPLVVYSGAAAPQRGLGIMIESLPQLEGVHVGLIVSHPLSAYVNELLVRADELGVAERVHTLPYVPYDEVVAYLSRADIGVIPIHHWPNHEIALITKFFEYAHARLPIVVSDVKAMAEATRATGVGEVFRAEDVEDYARAVTAVLADPAQYRKVYEDSELLDRWTWANQARILDNVYRRLVPHPPERD